jgi:transposase
MSSLRTSKTDRTLPESIHLADGEMIHVGTDVHKKTYHIALHSVQRGPLATWVQPASPDVLLQWLRPIREHVAGVVYEAGPTGFDLARRLQADKFPVKVVAASKLPVVRARDSKSDRLDCRKLALYSAKGLLHSVRIPTAQEEADRQVLRLRDQMIRKARTAQQQIKSFLLQHGIAEPAGLGHWSGKAIDALRGLELLSELRFCLDLLLDELAHAQEQVEKATRRLRELSRVDRHKQVNETLQSVPGVGLVTAMSFRLELPEPERFDDQGQVAKMIGLAPQVRQSGETRHEGGILKSGNERLRTVLVEAAWRWVACDEAARDRYKRLVANTGSANKAIVGMARRLGVLLWRMSVREEAYRMVS